MPYNRFSQAGTASDTPQSTEKTSCFASSRVQVRSLRKALPGESHFSRRLLRRVLRGQQIQHGEGQIVAKDVRPIALGPLQADLPGSLFDAVVAVGLGGVQRV